METSLEPFQRQSQGCCDKNPDSGCCICGNPILQYHHIVEWKDEPHFPPEDMMVLCPLHHDQATKGALPESEQRKSKANPKNIVQGRAKGLLAVRQDYCAAALGTITVVGEGPFLRIDGEEILNLNLDNGNLEISLRLYDQDNQRLLEIVRNEWISGDPLPWDIVADWQVLELRERARKITFSLNAKPIPLEIRADLWRNNKNVRIDKEGIFVSGRVSLGLQHLALVGTTLDVDTEKVTIGAVSSASGTNPVIISWGNPRERLWKAKDAWRKIKLGHPVS